jgi:hypothetical protein
MNAKIVNKINTELLPKNITIFGNGFVFNEQTKHSHFIIPKISKSDITILTPDPISKNLDNISEVISTISKSVEYYEQQYYKLRVEPYLKH